MKDEIKEKCSNCEYSRQCFTMKQINSECCLKDKENEKKDEIKEILDYLGNDKNYNCDCNDGSYYLELPYREAHELKDCITNLQEELEEEKRIEQEDLKTIQNLEEENKRLKEMKDKIITKLKEEVSYLSYLMPYGIYRVGVETIVKKVEKIANGDDKDEV